MNFTTVTTNTTTTASSIQLLSQATSGASQLLDASNEAVAQFVADQFNNVTRNDTDPLMFGHVRTISRIANIGYLLSLLTLIFALIILTCIKRLRSPKNNIHLQLFISFIIRCSLHLIKLAMMPSRSEGLMIDYSTLSHGFTLIVFLAVYFLFPLNMIDSPNPKNSKYQDWPCRLITVVWQYSLMANYNWILMEGVYLYSLIFFAAISPYGPSIISYTIFGWTIPLVFIIPWMVLKAKYEDESCWLLNTNEIYFWILRAPVTLSILVNFFIYIRIVLVVYSKIFSGNMTLQISKRTAENNYKRLLRSTLVLIPLFGVHYSVLLVLEQVGRLSQHELIEVIWLYIETTFSSCQGCIVACLYCFLNGEVHQEVKKLWIKWSK